MSDSKSRHALPVIVNAHQPLERLAERCRRIAELADQLASIIREIDKVSPSAAAEVYVIGGRVCTTLLAGVSKEAA